MNRFPILACLMLAACGNPPGPSVPMQTGQSLQSARHAVNACSHHAPRGGDDAMVSGYITGVLLAGIIIGPIVVSSNKETIRANGEATAVDKCLAKKGFVRRDLTEAEIRALNERDAYQRGLLLDHLIGGGTIDMFARA